MTMASNGGLDEHGGSNGGGVGGGGGTVGMDVPGEGGTGSGSSGERKVKKSQTGRRGHAYAARRGPLVVLCAHCGVV